MKDQKLEIIEDWEREYLKDFIYLHETGQDLTDAIQEEINKRLPALITVIDKDKILERKHEPESYTLPF